MIRIWLLSPRCVCHPSVPLGQREVSVHCVWIQRELTAVFPGSWFGPVLSSMVHKQCECVQFSSRQRSHS
uniref:Uncharacterized protein n=1 Tax=Anguilla anguilla TaxID=7936 RepID=A0A0E9XB35_ANGAN